MVWNRNSREVNSNLRLGPDGIYKKLFTKSSDNTELSREIDALAVLKEQFSGKGSTAYWSSSENVPSTKVKRSP